MEQEKWPRLSYEEGKETYETIHLWTQIMGKIKMRSLPWINHSWHVTLQITPTGLTTGDLPSEKKDFQINLDFLEHQLTISTSQNETRTISLLDLSVAKFYEKLMNELKKLDISVIINKKPNEFIDPIAFDEDDSHSTYVPKVAEAFQRALLKTNKVLTVFRSTFIGKCSPVHFYWGSFDLAVSRFSGRKAPEHPAGFPNLPDWVAKEAYSHEVSSCGFWPGNAMVPFAAFYSYIYPEPAGYDKAVIEPGAAYYHQDLGEFVLPYSEVQRSDDPEKMLLSFLQSTYSAAADLAGWKREELEKS